MRISLFFFLALCITQSAFCQSGNKAPAIITTSMLRLNTEPVTFQLNPKLDRQYDLQTINKKLKTDRRCIIAGAVLTGTGGALLITGFFFMIPSRRTIENSGNAHVGKTENFAPFIFWFSGFPALVPGIPTLAIGVTQRNKWKKRKDQLKIQGGIMTNGHVGLAMNF